MKIYLASFFEIDNHGPGRKIGICPSKPKELEYECELYYPYLSPGDLYWDYHKAKKQAGDDEGLLKQAGLDFVSGYKNRLKDMKTEVDNISSDTGKSLEEILELEDGDTLLSWEKEGNTSHRTAVAKFLRELGYEVELH
jgi:hypothetical protein